MDCNLCSSFLKYSIWFSRYFAEKQVMNKFNPLSILLEYIWSFFVFQVKLTCFQPHNYFTSSESIMITNHRKKESSNHSFFSEYITGLVAFWKWRSLKLILFKVLNVVLVNKWYYSKFHFLNFDRNIDANID